MELDPHGKDAHEAGAKLDQGKNRLGLVLGSFSRSLWAVGEVGTYGARKYSDHGWEQVPDGSKRYLDAMLRHYFKHSGGEISDPDTGIPHLAHAAWNVLAALELNERGKNERT